LVAGLVNKQAMSFRFRSFWPNISKFNFRYCWLIFISLLIHRLPFLVFLPSEYVPLKKTAQVISYILLVFVLVKNWSLKSVRLLLIGVLMNFIAIIANGGLMPVSPEARYMAGMKALDITAIGNVLPQGSGILLTLDQTRLWFFTDIIPLRLVYGVFSVGDIIILLGLLFLAVELIYKACQRVPLEERRIIAGNQ
jgi:hypothetical protein